MSRGADGKFVKKAERIVDNAENDQFAMNRESASAAAVDAGFAQAEQFPTSKLSAAEDVDRMNMLKLQLQDDPVNAPGITKFGRLDAKDEYFEWLLRKKDAAKAVAFQDWYAKNFDRMGPAAKELSRELYPEFYNQREATLEENIDTVRKIAKLKIFGPRSQEDIALQFALDEGFIDTTYLSNLINPGAVADDNKESKAKLGLLNPNRYLFHAAGTTTFGDYNKTHDPKGTQRDATSNTSIKFWNWGVSGQPQALDNIRVLQSLGLGGSTGQLF